jgi:hypothetical protein
MSLTEIGRKYGTDKVSHMFTEYYDTIFKNMRNEKFNFLEIGVFFGSSIKMWNEYFQNATIYGIDTFEGLQGNGHTFKNADSYYKDWKQNKPTNVELIKMDQSSRDELKTFVEYCKGNNISFKVIIDDGSHLMYDQQISFFYLWELLDDDGIFVIEDIHTSEQDDYDLNVQKTNSTKDIFMKMKNNKSPFRSIYVENLELCDKISKEIKLIDLHYSNKDSQTLAVTKKLV